jgi:hypothetical protein
LLSKSCERSWSFCWNLQCGREERSNTAFTDERFVASGVGDSEHPGRTS